MEESKFRYERSILRYLSYIIDLAIAALFMILVNYFNIASEKSFWIYFIGIIIAVIYKPLSEFYFGRTLGKYIFNIKVVNENFEAISLKQALIRNIFFMLPSLLTIPFYYLAFNNIEIVKINDLKGFATFIASSYPSQSIFSNGASIIIFIDLIFLIVDPSKKGKSLHDKLSKTYVIKYTLTN